MRRADLVKINLVDVACLGLGFLTSLLVPKLAIDALGPEGYGVVAVLLGITLIPSFLELGLTPGLTRQLGKLHATGSRGSIRRVVLRFQISLGAAGVVVTAAAAYIASERDLAGAGWQITFLSVAAGGMANVLVLLAELGLIQIRVAGGFVMASLSRACYSIVYLSGVTLFYMADTITIRSVFLAQLGGACAFFAVTQFLTSRLNAADPATDAPINLGWRRLGWNVVPEQIGRVQSSLLPSLERHYLHVIGGPVTVSAYDVALRLAALVTAVPGAITSPLVALFSKNVLSAALDTNRRILQYMDRVTWVVVILSGTAVLLIARDFAVGFYHLEQSPLLTFSMLIVIGSGINALTASRVALLYAHDKPLHIAVKSMCDLAFACAGIILMVAYRDPIIFVAMKYLGFVITTAGLFVFCATQISTLERKSGERA